MRNPFAAFAVSAMLFAAASSAAAAEEIALTGYVRSYAGVLLREDPGYSIVQNTLSLHLEQAGERIAFKAAPFLYHYPEWEIELGLREAYVDIYLDSLDLRLGRQQIIWGKGEGVFITDVVSPKDLRQFILPDFTEVRLGITALRADYYVGNSTFELVLAPLFVPSRQPEAGSIWHLAPPFPFAFALNPVREVERSLENGEVFARYAHLGSALDFELMAGLMWDDDPSLRLSRTIDPVTGQVTRIEAQPEYDRLALAGGSASAALGGVVLRGEAAGYFGKRFSTLDPQDADGLVEKDYLHYLVGLDFGLAGLDLSAQLIQRVIFDYDDPIVPDRFDSTVTFRIGDTLLRDTLRLELFAYIGLNEPDALLRPKATYTLADGFEIVAGADIFLGQEGTFGRFDGNDQAYLKVKYSF